MEASGVVTVCEPCVMHSLNSMEHRKLRDGLPIVKGENLSSSVSTGAMKTSKKKPHPCVVFVCREGECRSQLMSVKVKKKKKDDEEKSDSHLMQKQS